MKKYRMILCLLLVMFLLVGCGQVDQWNLANKAAEKLSAITEDEQLLTDTQQLLDAVIADDYDAARAVVNSRVSDADLRNAFGKLRQELANVTDYELVASGIHKSVVNGVSTITVRYMMAAGDQRFLLEAVRRGEEAGLLSCAIETYTQEEITGTLSRMQGATPLQWALLIFGGLVLVFVLVVFVDCCRQKIPKKWLWLLIIALAVTVSANCSPLQFRVGANLGIVLVGSRLVTYSSGGFALNVTLPAGAIVYLCMRKNLQNKYRMNAQKQMEANSQVDPVQENPPEEIL